MPIAVGKVDGFDMVLQICLYDEVFHGIVGVLTVGWWTCTYEPLFTGAACLKKEELRDIFCL